MLARRFGTFLASLALATATLLSVVAPTLGGGGGGTPIIGLELQIDSAIDVSTFMAQPTQNGHTTASGTIALQGDATSGWHGTGNLASTTDLQATLSCQVTKVTGSGTYDWLVSNVHAGPGVSADAVTVDMDSGPISENPDKVVTDACGQTFDSTTNTWENLFFDVYRPRYQSAGFRVDGWKAVGGDDVWTSGGTVATATWTGACNSTLILGCKDQTTFTLTAVVTGTATGPSATAASSDAPEPLITPLPLAG